MKIVYMGSGEFGIDCLNSLKSSTHSLELLVTAPAHGAGRGKKLRQTAVAIWAQDNNIPFIEAENVNNDQVFKKIESFSPDLLVVIAFGQKIGNDLIDLAPHKAINVHASLLPKYRGAAPINHAMINGESQTGVTMISLAEKMDAGDILSQAKTDIKPEETAGQLHDRLAQLAGGLLLETIEQIESGTAVYTAQNHSQATLAPKLKKSDGFVDFNEPAELIERKVRGFWPWPQVSAIYFSKKSSKRIRVAIGQAEVVRAQNDPSLPPGTLDKDLNVVCGRDALKIVKIKPAGRSLMEFNDFVNGHGTGPGDLFMKIEK